MGWCHYCNKQTRPGGRTACNNTDDSVCCECAHGALGSYGHSTSSYNPSGSHSMSGGSPYGVSHDSSDTEEEYQEEECQEEDSPDDTGDPDSSSDFIGNTGVEIGVPKMKPSLESRIGELSSKIIQYRNDLSLDNVATLVEALIERAGLLRDINENDRALADYSTAIDHARNSLKGFVRGRKGKLKHLLSIISKKIYGSITDGPVTASSLKDLKGVDSNDSRSLNRLSSSITQSFMCRAALKHSQGDHASAVEEANKGIKHDPEISYLYASRGSAFLNQKKYEAAIRDFTNAIDIDIKASFFASRGEARRQNKDLDGAISDCLKAITLDSRCLLAWFFLAQSKSDKGDHEGSIKDYTRAIELDTEAWDSYNNRGIEKNDMGDFEGAIEDYTRAIEINPRKAFPYKNRGVTKKRLNDFEGAIEDYTRAIEIDPKDAFSYKNRGDARREENDKEGAIEDYTRAIKIEPMNAQLYRNRGIFRKSLGLFEEGNMDMAKASELDKEKFPLS